MVRSVARKDHIAFTARDLNIVGVKIDTDPISGAVGFVDCSVKPPGAIVVPEMMVRTGGLLSAG